MSQALILYPVLATVALTFVVLAILLSRRGACLRRRGVGVNQLAGTRDALAHAPEGPMWDTRTMAAGDQFTNLFETPVLFYVMAIALLAVEAVTPLALFFAWVFVIARIVHAFIHLTYNLVGHRLVAYGISVLAIATLAVCLFVSLI